MGTPEVPLEHAHETIEHQAHGSSEPWVMGVALTAAILAALAAVTALCAEHFSIEAMLERIDANDKWSEFQFNSLKEKMLLGNKRILTKLQQELDPEDEAKLAEYKEKKGGIEEESRDLVQESNRHFRKQLPLSAGLTMFQVAIAIGAISVLTKRREFWFVCLAFGVIGVGFLILGLAS
jgi:hypothetical protein